MAKFEFIRFGYEFFPVLDSISQFWTGKLGKTSLSQLIPFCFGREKQVWDGKNPTLTGSIGLSYGINSYVFCDTIYVNDIC